MPLTRAKDIIVLAQGGVAAPHTGNTTETTLATITLPAGMMGANGRIEITTLWSMTNNANNKQLRVKFGTAQPMTIGATSVASLQSVTFLANRNSASSQAFYNPGNAASFGSGTAAISTSAIDTSADVTILITGQLANAADTVTLENYIVTVYPRR